MKPRQRMVMLAFAVGFGATALAVAPERFGVPDVLWNGDFTSLTKDGYAITLGDGNAVSPDGSCIAIGDAATKGVKVSGGDIFTLVIKVSGYTPSASDCPEVVAAMLYGDNSYVGLGAKNDQKGWYLWNNGAWGSTYVTATTVFTNAATHAYAISYRYDESGQISKGTRMYADGSLLADASGLCGKALTNAVSVSIGGPQSGSGLKTAKGMKIEGIALFTNTTVSADVAAKTAFPDPALQDALSDFTYAAGVYVTEGSGEIASQNRTYTYYNPRRLVPEKKFVGHNTTYDAGEIPGSSVGGVFWPVFSYSDQAAAQHYSAPGSALYFPAGSGTAIGATFGPLTLGGICVPSGATGYSLTQSGNDRTTLLGDPRDPSEPAGSADTLFRFDEDFAINRQGALYIMGHATFDIAEGKTLTLQASYAGFQPMVIGWAARPSKQLVMPQPGGTLTLKGAGRLTATTLTVTNTATIDYAAIPAVRATPYVNGTLVMDGTTGIRLPADLQPRTAFRLANSLSGVASGTTVRDISVGDAARPGATVTFDAAGGTIEYDTYVAEVGGTSYTTVSAAVSAAEPDATVTLLRDFSEVVAVDKSLTIDLNGHTLGGTLAVGAAGRVALVAGAGGVMTAAVSGAGVIACPAGVLPAGEFLASLALPQWTGTLWIRDLQMKDFDFARYGHANSTVKLSGITGYAPNSNAGFDGTLVLADVGDTPALSVTDGYSDRQYHVARLAGDGTFKFTNAKGCTAQYRFRDVSLFTGAIDASADGYRRVVVGEGTAVVPAGGQILVASDASAFVATNRIWKSYGGVRIEGILSLGVSGAGAGALTGGVRGGGTLVYAGSGDAAFPAAADGLTSGDWTGTVWFTNFTSNVERTPASYGNVGSTVKYTNVRGWLSAANTSAFTGTVAFEDGADGVAALEILDGSSGWGVGKAVKFAHVTGTGTLKANWDGGYYGGCPYVLRDVSGFSGSIAASQAGSVGFYVGETNAWSAADKGKVVLVGGTAATVGAGATWTAASGIRVDGLIGGAGTLASAVVFGDGATITGSDLTASGSVSFGATLDVTVGVAAHGTPVLTVTQAQANPATAVTANGEAGFGLVYDADAGKIKLYKPAPTVFAVTGITSQPSTNFDGSAVTVSYSAFAQGGYDGVDVKVTVNGQDFVYDGPLQSGGGSFTVHVDDEHALAGHVESAVVSVTGVGTEKGGGEQCVAFAGTTYLDQGVVTNTATANWFETSVTRFEDDGTWSVPNPDHASGPMIVFDETDEGVTRYTFTPNAPASDGQGTVLEMAMSFDAAVEKSLDVPAGAQGACCLVPVGDSAYRFAMLDGGAWYTNMTFEAALNTDYTVRMAFDYRVTPAALAYSVKTNGGAYVTLRANAVNRSCKTRVEAVSFDGSGKLSRMAGEIATDLVDASLIADANGTHYRWPDDVSAALCDNLLLIWDMSWTPDPDVEAVWMIHDGGHTIDIAASPGVMLEWEGGVYTIKSGYFEVQMVGGAETKYMTFDDMLKDPDASSVRLLRALTRNRYTLPRSMSLDFNGFSFVVDRVDLKAYDLMLTGASPATVPFWKLLGTGTLTYNSTAALLATVTSGFAGSVVAGAGCGGVVFGQEVPAATTGKITLAADASATVAAGKSWTAASGIQIDGAIGGAGTLASAATFGDTATITNGTLTASVAPIFGDTLNVTIPEAAHGTPVLSVPSMDDPTVAVTANDTPGFSLVYANGALKLYKYVPTVFTVSSIAATPQTNFNGSAVAVTYGPITSGTAQNPQLKLTVNGHTYVYGGALVAGGGTATFQVADADAQAGSVKKAVVTLESADSVKGGTKTDFEGTQYLYQGAYDGLITNAWFAASAGTLATGGTWEPTPTVENDKILFPEDDQTGALKEYAFTPTAAQQGQVAVVEADVSFEAALDMCPIDISDLQGAFCIVTDGSTFRFAALVNGAWVTNTTLTAGVSTEYKVRTTIDYHRYPVTIKYEVKSGDDPYVVVQEGNVRTGLMSLGSVSFAGEGKLAQMTGSDISADVDSSLVADAGIPTQKYGTIDAATAAGVTNLTLLWNTSWTPNASADGAWRINQGSYKLYLTTGEGVWVKNVDGIWTIYSNYFEAMNVSGKDGAEAKYTYFTNAVAQAGVSYTNVYLLKNVTLDETLTINKTITFNGETNELKGANADICLAVGAGKTVTIASGFIGIKPDSASVTAERFALTGGRYSDTSKDWWTAPSGYTYSQLAISLGDYKYQLMREALAPKDDTQVLLPVKDSSGEVVSITLNKSFAAVAAGTDKPEQQAQILSQKEDNGLVKWENAVLGLSGDAGDIPVVAPNQSGETESGKIKFSLGNVNTTTIESSGATVKYRVFVSSTPGGKDGAVSNYTDPADTVGVPLPTAQEGVKYYTIQVDTATAK